MVELDGIDQYYKVGRGKVYQFYISDKEMASILIEKLSSEFSPYDLIVSRWDGKTKFTHHSFPVTDFSKLRSSGEDRFYLRSRKITPELNIPVLPITKQSSNLYEKYYLYNGLIDLQHGFLLKHKYWEDSSIGMIDKFFKPSAPDEILENKEYIILFKKFEKELKLKLKFKSSLKLTNGKEIISKHPNVSAHFAELLNKNAIISTITIA